MTLTGVKLAANSGSWGKKTTFKTSLFINNNLDVFLPTVHKYIKQYHVTKLFFSFSSSNLSFILPSLHDFGYIIKGHFSCNLTNGHLSPLFYAHFSTSPLLLP